MNIPQAIKNIRERKKIKQCEAAKGIGITQTYLSLIENGQKVPSIEVLERMAKFYKTPYPIMLWESLEEKDIQKNRLTAFRELKPSIDAIISTFI